MNVKDKQGFIPRDAGFTLVEVVVATALVILALALFLGTFVSARRSAMISDQCMEAVENARSNMESLVSSAYASSCLSNGPHPATGSVSNVPNNISYSVAAVTQTPNIIVKNIYLTNRWINPGSTKTSSITLVGSVSLQLHP